MGVRVFVEQENLYVIVCNHFSNLGTTVDGMSRYSPGDKVRRREVSTFVLHITANRRRVGWCCLRFLGCCVLRFLCIPYLFSTKISLTLPLSRVFTPLRYISL